MILGKKEEKKSEKIKKIFPNFDLSARLFWGDLCFCLVFIRYPHLAPCFFEKRWRWAPGFSER
jgi:hypothetical protein